MLRKERFALIIVRECNELIDLVSPTDLFSGAQDSSVPAAVLAVAGERGDPSLSLPRRTLKRLIKAFRIP